MSFMRNFINPPGPSDHEVAPTPPNEYLNPNQAFIENRMKDAVLHPNGDRLSAVSLRDEEDYSRPVLRVRPSIFTLLTLLCSSQIHWLIPLR
jgi:cell wall integrity and stress response component